MEIEINNVLLPCWIIRVIPFEGCCYYTLVYGENNTPLLKKGKIQLLNEVNIAKVLGLNSSLLDDYVELDLDVPAVLEALLNQEEDFNSTVLNAFNLMSDFFDNNIIRIDNSALKRCYDILYPFADFLTFQRKFYGDYIKSKSERIKLYNAFCFLIGNVMNSFVVEDNLPNFLPEIKINT